MLGSLDQPIPPLRTLTTDRGDAGRRIDLVLRRHLTDVNMATRTRVQAWIEGGRVTRNGTLVRRVATRTAAGDVLTVALPPGLIRQAMAAEEVPVSVLYEDEHLLVLDKPAGMVVHPTHKHLAGTIMNALLWHARAWPSTFRPSIVGRLDKLTSGLVVVAKTAAIHTALQRTLSSRDSEKDYLAIVYGRVNRSRGVIDLGLRRDPGDRRRVIASTTLGAASVTMFERLGRTSASRTGLSLLRCRLVTGRTHQIRVHLAATGWPIVGDPVYGEPRWKEIADPDLAASLRHFPRQALHAWRVALTHPVTQQVLRVEAPVPADIAELMVISGLWTPFQASAAKPEPRGSRPTARTTPPRMLGS
jgi:23S rRNA pseudouridine1911/1915/1917 synthase